MLTIYGISKFGDWTSIESVFAMQGIGYLAWESILRNDIAVIQAILLIVCLFYVGLTFISDLVNAWLDPRIRVS